MTSTGVKRSLSFSGRLTRHAGVGLLALSLGVAGAGLPLNKAQAGGGWGHGGSSVHLGYSHYGRGGGNGGAIAAAAIGLATIVGLGVASHRAERRADEAYDTGYDDGYAEGYGGGYDDRRFEEHDDDEIYGERSGPYGYAPEDDLGGEEELAYDDSRNCRRTRGYTTTVIIRGEARDAVGSECQLPDGSWQRGPASLDPR